MTRDDVIRYVWQAGNVLSAIPAGRVDSVTGIMAFQVDVVTFRGLFAEFVWALQDDDQRAVLSCLDRMGRIGKAE